MRTVNIHEAKTHLSRLLAEVAEGQEIVIAKFGRPVARIIAYEAPVARRRFGQDRGLFQVPDDFDAPLPDEIQEAFDQ